MKHERGFASDNNSGFHPQILHALEEANRGHHIAYGDDPYSDVAAHMIRSVLDCDAEVFFVFGGTGANVTAIQASAHSFEGVGCAETAHINEDECGAPEKFSGCKLLTLPTDAGKINSGQIKPILHSVGFEHHVQPRVISITQSTELGTVYQPDEVGELADFAHANNMVLHMDGARIANAAAYFGNDLRGFTRDAGVDIFSFGGTKNGMIFGEALVFLNMDLAKHFKYIRKQSMQLFSKMRYIAAQYQAMLEDDLWLKCAQHSNNMARLLEKEIRKIDGIRILFPVEANAVFAEVPKALIKPLQEEFFFYVWDEEKNWVRWMTSFDTTEEDIKQFTTAINRLV